MQMWRLYTNASGHCQGGNSSRQGELANHPVILLQTFTLAHVSVLTEMRLLPTVLRLRVYKIKEWYCSSYQGAAIGKLWNLRDTAPRGEHWSKSQKALWNPGLTALSAISVLSHSLFLSLSLSLSLFLSFPLSFIFSFYLCDCSH